jgi:hypothetical protein
MPQVLVGADAEAAFQRAGGAAEMASTTRAKASLVDKMEAEVAAGNVTTIQQENPTAEPELILGKFKSVEDLAASYQQLEKKLSSGGKEQPAVAPIEAEAPEAEPDAAPADAEPEGDAPAGLSDEQAAQIQAAVLQAAGGAEEFAKLAAWARRAGDEMTVNTFNSALQQGNVEVATVTLKALRYDYLQERGFEPELLGGRASSGGLQPFASQAEVKAAMSDPRYYGTRQDPAYVREVEQRLALRPVFNIRE